MENKDKIKEMISMFDKTIATYEANQIRIYELEGFENDIRHEISIGKKRGVVDGYKLYEKQRNILLERYEKKDENELLHELYVFCKANEKVKSKLNKIYSGIGNTENRLENRVYKPRFMSPSEMTVKTFVELPKEEFELIIEKGFTKATRDTILGKSELEFDKVEVNQASRKILCYKRQ